MKQTFKTLIAAAAVASMVGAAGTASAANTAAQAKCHGAIAKNIAKYQATLAKNLAACTKSRNAAKIANTTDCGDAVQADLKLKRTDTITKIKETIVKSCPAPVDAEVIFANYPRCPSPKKTVDDGGATDGIDTVNELVDCLVAVSEDYMDKIGDQVVGNPSAADIGALLGPGLPKGLQTCANALAKSIGTVLKGADDALKCQAAQEKLLVGLDYGPTCVNDVAVGAAVLKGTTAMDAAIDKSCDPLKYMLNGRPDYRKLGVCGETNANLKVCAGDRVVEPLAKGLTALALEIPNDGTGQNGNLVCKAGGADVIINAAYGQKYSDTRLDAGWTGFSHGVDVVDQYKGRVLLTGCDEDCEGCSVTIDTSAGNCRCENNAADTCDSIEASDVGDCGMGVCGGGTNDGTPCSSHGDCTGGGKCNNTCHCMFGPPLALSASGTPTCVVNRFVSDFSGTTGAVGEYDVTTETRALVHTGIGAMNPCPRCVGGTCTDGPRSGLSCTVDATHPNFGPVSFDCPPNPGGNISGDGLRLALQFKSGSTQINAAINNPSYCQSGTCHCSVCTGDPLVGCSTDQECIDLGVGTCGTNIITGAGNPKENDCDGGPSDCVADPENPGMGVCDSGPFNNFCDGAVRLNGTGIIPCITNGDCSSLDSFCPGGDCGDCTTFDTDTMSEVPNFSVQRSCFLPTVSATGVPGIFSSEGVSTFCSAPTGALAVDSAGGLPGPGRVRLAFDFNVWCEGSTTNRFNLPAGSNCP